MDPKEKLIFDGMKKSLQRIRNDLWVVDLFKGETGPDINFRSALGEIEAMQNDVRGLASLTR